jgi:hypothetical protein
LKAHDAGKPDGHVGKAGEVEIDLDSEAGKSQSAVLPSSRPNSKSFSINIELSLFLHAQGRSLQRRRQDHGREAVAFGMSRMLLTFAPVTAQTDSRQQHHHRGTDRHAIIEILYIFVDKSMQPLDAAVPIVSGSLVPCRRK